MEDRLEPEKSENPKPQPEQKEPIKSCPGVPFSYYSGFISGYRADYGARAMEIRKGRLN